MDGGIKVKKWIFFFFFLRAVFFWVFLIFFLRRGGLGNFVVFIIELVLRPKDSGPASSQYPLEGVALGS